MVKSSQISSPIQRPSFLKYVGEHIRVWGELRRSYYFRRSYQPVTKGDGHPVLVIPGFLGSDLSTGRVRRFIERLGYTPYGWDQERNLGNLDKLNTVIQKIEELHDQHQTKVSLLGWSLGGVYARQLAKAKPESVRQVITMGSPFAGINEPNNAKWLFDIINRGKEISEENKKRWMLDIPAPAPVPTTAIYSKNDGIVPWQACMEITEDELRQNIEIEGCHFGLGHNPEVWKILEDRLQYSQKNWKKFKKS